MLLVLFGLVAVAGVWAWLDAQKRGEEMTVIDTDDEGEALYWLRPDGGWWHASPDSWEDRLPCGARRARESWECVSEPVPASDVCLACLRWYRQSAFSGYLEDE